MYVSMYGDATYQITRTDGMTFADEPKSVTYEVDGGIAAGKTHDEIAAQVDAIKAASATPEEEAAAPAEPAAPATPVAAPEPAEPATPAANGAATSVATGTLMGIITGTLML